jgi:hypothetical protein
MTNNADHTNTKTNNMELTTFNLSTQYMHWERNSITTTDKETEDTHWTFAIESYTNICHKYGKRNKESYSSWQGIWKLITMRQNVKIHRNYSFTTILTICNNINAYEKRRNSITNEVFKNTA